jgi:glycosyltransferase involved in cell wall biosynthesis
MSKKHITVLVSNDLEFDQRVAKVCATLESIGFDITLVGRRLPTSKEFSRSYEVKRFSLFFHRGMFFYAALNLRLFFYLFFKKTDVILANDLDTLLPAFLVSRWRKKQLVYDSHEYFTEAEGLTGRGFQKSVWLFIEKRIFPKLKNIITVNESIASIYSEKYRVSVNVVRNIPFLKDAPVKTFREELNLPTDKKIILLQGAFIDPDRGGKEALEAMQYMNDVLLLIIGSGREMPLLREMASTDTYREKVKILPKMPFEELRKYTMSCDLGLTLDKPLHLNYTLSLPNKLFDYIHCEIPVLGSNLPEIKNVIQTYNVGWLVDEVNAKAIAEAAIKALNDPSYSEKKSACKIAKEKLNWQREEEVLRKIYEPIFKS